ncbi:MAG: hypothetical protein ACR2JO_01730 [Mycobacteriales bacterium]
MPEWVRRLSAGDWSAPAGTVDAYPHVGPWRRWRSAGREWLAANGYPASSWYELTRPVADRGLL